MTRNVFVTIQARTVAPDGQGQDIETWSNKYIAVPGRLSDVTGRVRASKDSILYKADFMLFMDRRFIDLDEAENRIIINNVMYKILDLGNPGGSGIHSEILIEQVR